MHCAIRGPLAEVLALPPQKLIAVVALLSQAVQLTLLIQASVELAFSFSDASCHRLRPPNLSPACCNQAFILPSIALLFSWAVAGFI